MSLMKGHIFKGRNDVTAPVMRVHVAITASIAAQKRRTKWNNSVGGWLNKLTKNTSNPMKHNVIPSAIHSIKMISLFSHFFLSK